MKKLNKIIVAVIVLIVSFSCDDILEKDIEDDLVTVIYPTDNAVIIGNTFQFVWQELDGADNYRIQITKDNLLNEVDSLVTTTRFTYPLSEGNYKWRIRGENFAYKTSYTFPISFSVQASTEISDYNIVLKTPATNHYTNDKNIIFTWDSIDIADTYTLEVVKKLGGDEVVFQQTDISTTSLSIDPAELEDDAEYQWRVKAVNATGETIFTERTFFVDTVNPNQPVLTDPADADVIGVSTVDFIWTNGVDTGNVTSDITNELEIATDSEFTSVIHTDNTTSNTLQYAFTSQNTYYWRVKAIDAATNESDYSSVRSLVVE